MFTKSEGCPKGGVRPTITGEFFSRDEIWEISALAFIFHQVIHFFHQVFRLGFV